MKILLASLAAVLVAAAGAARVAAQASPSAADLARLVQQHYDGLRDFQATFTQVYRGGFTPPQPEQHGTMRIKRPGRMRWSYSGSRPQEIWSDGVRLYNYQAASRSVQESALPSGADASPTMLFLLDRGNLVRDFTASLGPDQPADAWRLTLVPRRPDPDATSLVVTVERTSLKLRGLETLDSQGGTNTITFSAYKENVGLSDKDLSFVWPAGTVIIR